MKSAMNAQTWEDIIADRTLRDLPYKIETNGYHKIIMSPLTPWLGHVKVELALELEKQMSERSGRATVRVPVQTSEGVRVAECRASGVLRSAKLHFAPLHET